MLKQVHIYLSNREFRH